MEVATSVEDIGWLDQNLLQHDNRWRDLDSHPDFRELVNVAMKKTTELRNSVIEDGIVNEFNESYDDAMASKQQN